MIPKVLFVDDEVNVGRAFQRLLFDYSEEFEWVNVGSADEALARLKADHFHLVITDFNMPGKNGLELIIEMNNDPILRDIPTVLLTGNTDRTLKRQALDAGATDLLNKPVEEEDLVARVRSLIKLRRQQLEMAEMNRSLGETVFRRTIELQYSRLEIIMRLAKAGELRDTDTGNHTMRVGIVSSILGERMGLSVTDSELILLAAPLHDIGKIGISDTILQKPGKLTAEEYAIMQEHCRLGWEILSAKVDFPINLRSFPVNPDYQTSEIIQKAAIIALQHHEKFDGTGYPNRLSGDQIHPFARIVAVADTFDALLSERPYKPAFSLEKTLEIINSERGKHFDPVIVEALTGALDQIMPVYNQLADDKGTRDAA